MPRAARGKKSGRPARAGRPRADTPPPGSIISVEEFKSPKSPRKVYQIIRTNETDAYDQVGATEDKPAAPSKRKRRRGR